MTDRTSKQDWRSRHTVVPAVYVVFRKGDEVLLLKRANTGYRDGDYSMPAGHFDGGESAITAAIREAKEEVGVDINPQDLKLVHTQNRVAESGDHERINLFFETRHWQGDIVNAEPDKCSELRWTRLDTLPENLVPELTYMLKHYQNDEPYGDFGF